MRKTDQLKIQFEKFRISLSADKKCWVLDELKEGGVYKGTGIKSENYWEEIGYYGRLEHLVPALLNREIEVPQSKSLDEQLKAILEEIKTAESRLLEQMRIIE